MRQLLRRLRNAITFTLISGLVLLAVAASLLRVFIAWAPDFRAEVESLLSQALERPLTLGGLRAEWSGVNPRLILEDVELGDARQGVLRVDELRVTVDLLGSVAEMRLKPAELGVEGLALTLQRAADGGWRLLKVGDMDLPADTVADRPLPTLPAELYLKAGEVVLLDLAADRRYHLPRVDLRLHSADQGIVLAGAASLPEALGRGVSFRAELDTLPRSLALTSGRVYLDARRLNLTQAATLLPPALELPALAGSLDAELWLELAAGQPRSLSGRLKGDGLRLKAGEDWRNVASRLLGRFHWQRQAGGWSLEADELEFVSDYRVWPKGHLRLSQREEGAQRQLQADAGYLRLEDLTPTLTALPMLPQALRQQLEALEPRGELRQPSLGLAWGPEGLGQYRLSAAFSELALKPVGRFPGATGLTGQLNLNQEGGLMELRGQSGEVSYPTLFRGPFPFRELRARLAWLREAEGWRLEAPRFELDSEDGQLSGRLRIFTDPAGRAPFLDLRAHLRGGNGHMTSRYLPAGILPPRLLDWLDNAIGGGHVPEADLVLYGPARDFPYHTDAGGVFDVRARVVQGQLNYYPGWPGITGIDGALLFHGNRMEITASRGRINNAQVEQARVWMDDLTRDDLHFEGRVSGDGPDLLRFLQDSPLGAPLRTELAAFGFSGRSQVELKATVPLRDGPVKVDGTLSLSDAALSIPRWGLAFDQLSGRLRFDQRGVYAERIQGRFRGQPLTLSASTGGAPGKGRIRLLAQGRASLQQLLAKPRLDVVSGLGDWRAEVSLPAFDGGGGRQVDIELSSSLAGVAVELPAPLGKDAGAERPLKARLSIGTHGLAPIWLSYGGDVGAVLDTADDGQRLLRATLHLGPGAPTLKQPLGLSVTGQVQTLDLDAWRRLTLTGARTSRVGADPYALDLARLDLRAGELRLAGQRFREARLRVHGGSAGWELGLEGPDLEGRLMVPRDPAAQVAGQLTRLRLSLAPATEASTAPSSAPAPAGGRPLPPLDVGVDELVLDEQPLGRLDLVVTATPEAMVIERAELIGPALEARVSGGWSRRNPETRLTVTVNSINAGQALALFGYQDAIRGGLVEASAELRWPGDPTGFSLRRATGAFELKLSNGQVLAVDPGAGRMFGLLSVAALPRRLSLDFSDLFDDGFAFDRIHGRFDLAEGNALVREFYMQGPAARVEFDGRIGLEQRDYDQVVTVMPKVGNALPAVGALAAGPVGAATLLVAQKLMEKQLDRMVRLRYRVTGSWEDPKVESITAGETGS